MASLIALLSAVAYGAADFLGGVAARRATTIAAVVVSQAAGVVLLLAVIPWLPPAMVSSRDMAWGAAAGLFGGSGVALLYRALAIGPMSVVAPVTAVCAAAVPVTFGLLLGERLGWLTTVGIAVAGIAIVLLGQERRDDGDAAGPPAPQSRLGIQLALASGLAIGCFLVSLARTAPSAGLWPLIPARIVSVGLFGILAVATRQPLLVPRPVMATAIGGGALDMLANALYLFAVQNGPLSIVATLASLYPASTVVLARFVLQERLSALQQVGIAAAVVATVLIVSGAH
ncbi:MAG TPA: DMT family transporter [Vicinamibacterales bacterium]|nr:DMT family transporter [Vicinamibacterales bacterium]